MPFEMVDAALAQTLTTQRRVRVLPSRVVVYLLLAAGLFTELGYGQVWARMIAGLDGPGGVAVARPGAAALAAARRRVGVAPVRALFDLLRGSGAGSDRVGVRWRGRLVTAIDGTILSCADTAANRAVYQRSRGNHGGSGYPLIRLLTVVACGTRTVLDAVFGTDRVGEISYAHQLLGALHPGTILLADRNFAVSAWIVAAAETGADVLVRVKTNRVLPVCARRGDGGYVSRIGSVEVRVITAQITITTSAGRRSEVYRLVTTVLDADCPAAEIVRLYHERWEIETSFLELKATLLGGRVLRAQTPTGVDQEIYALLVTYQALRIAISDATSDATGDQPGPDPDRASFTVALHAARDQLVLGAGVLTDTSTDAVVDLVGRIGRAVLAHLMPARRLRTSPRVVKRAISKYVSSSAKGRHRGPSRNATISIDIPTATGP